ncbi:MAG: hypothetical protein MUO52_02590 [Desulfobacterales bacterium]|nr:hypothetical protein [Desulfobacterales bacterium]
MSEGVEKRIFYFAQTGPINTDRTLDIALACCEERKIPKIIVASSTGTTALRLKEKAKPALEIIAVASGAGSRFTDQLEEFNRNRELLVEKGIRIVRGVHALSATERAFEHKYKSALTPLNLVSDTLRMFCAGVKVCVEIAIMAAEAGFTTPDEEVVAVAGTGRGCDTAMVLNPAYAATMFDIKIKALLCMPA